MTDNELIELFLDTEEGERFECKRVEIKPSDALKTIVAFANKDGGIFIVGIDDKDKIPRDKRLRGVNSNYDNVSELLKLVDKDIDPPLVRCTNMEMEIVNISGGKDKILLFRVEKGHDIHSLKNGDTYIRKGNQNVKIGAQDIIRLRYEKGTIKYEDELTNIASLDDIDKELLDIYKKDNLSLEIDTWSFLVDNALAQKKDGKNYLTVAGGLLFLKNPSVQLRGKYGVKVSRYYGTERSYTKEPNLVHKPITIEGTLMYQIRKVMEYFYNIQKESPPKLSGAVFTPKMMIPDYAFQEAVTNAVIHRNYYIPDDIQIRFFDDRIEIESPGTYPGHVNSYNLRSERFSRNPIIQRTLNRFTEAPNLDIGEGVDRMFQSMKKSNLYDPFYIPASLKGNSVDVILFNLKRVETWDAVSEYLDKNNRINNTEARRITGIDDTLKMSKLFRQWVTKGILEMRNAKSTKYAYYVKPGTDISQSLFSRRGEKKK
ncbi:hypothetical protein A3H26_03935 [candidate division WWE3 bacterium RIFCSPLOWO2_12_FULL_36_10]|uniref:Schlafen AlbA-2 domain-containing protein n=1 Tax=candidate division WWE3 bacterium RIFCSPLOWO2_12_FULL_36_10 TaxID=1802630 RepID=A0A1F4VL41_UNCKA|nr:MAG: hypothetical protein A3H26_03935 [candidate division WWE3 bacterium RIFCSPLOWO2_12_FULL_36_10]